MDILLSLLLQLQNAQHSLNQMQSARTARTSEVRSVRPNAAPVVKPATKAFAPVAAVPQTAPSATQTAPAQNADYRVQIEQHVLAETNAARAQNGLKALSADTGVAAVARAHSTDMLTKNYFEHTNLSGCNAGCRLTNAGYVWRTYGENIHWMSGYKLSAQDSAKKIVNDWMNSPGHRANILGSFTYAGVGIAVSGDKIYSTTDYTTK